MLKDSRSMQSETYRQDLFADYPESEFAKILADPDYFEKKPAEMKMSETLYEKAYNLYASEDFAESVNVINASLEQFPEDNLAPKFSLLKAYNVARTDGETSFKEELYNIIKKYPETAEAKRAMEILENIIK
jgi:TolA-binding protein